MSEAELAILYPEMYGEEDPVEQLTIVGDEYLGTGN